MTHTPCFSFVCSIILFLLLCPAQAQNTCGSPHNLPGYSGQNCPGGITATTVNQNFDPNGPSSGQPTPGCWYVNGYDDNWHRAVVPPNAGGVEVYFSNIRDCRVGGFLTSCFTELECAVYSGPNCNALSYYGCLEVGYGEALLGVHLFSGAGGILIGGYPGDEIYLRTYEADDQNMSYTIDYVAALPPGSFCGFPLPLTVNGCNHGGFGASFNPPDAGSATGCWFSNENTVFYSFDVTPATPQPVQITVHNIACSGGGSQLQMAIYDNNCGTVGGAGPNYHGHACGNGTVTLTSTTNPLPVGTYFLVVDGDAGANCTWEFSGGVVLDANYRHIHAEYRDFAVELDWETGVERNNMGFFVERSLDGDTWKEIGFVNGAFESDVPVAYQYTDRELLSNVQYYRLRQVDMGGAINYSYTVEATIDYEVAGGLRVNALYPNPATGTANMSLTVSETVPVSVDLLDLTGQTVKRFYHNEFFEAGIHHLELDLYEVRSGMYFCRISTSGNSFVEMISVANP